jgi:1-aminocyclopropane-1-carboxylate deaminase/D-cysteine desulfhydrase-like pyridoxal-dependent ACC family enzyme
MTPEELEKRLEAFPRVKLGEYPTALQYLPALSKELGRDVFCKRDDQIAAEFCGNKTRALEFLIADAIKRHPKKIATFGALQSNHARITATTAIRFGIEPHLFYLERRPESLEGNVLINQRLGAHLHFLPLSQSGKMRISVAIHLVHALVWLSIGPHYFIPVGAHSWLGCLGYVQAAVEIDRQVRELGINNAYLILATGTGATLAGLMSGFLLINSKLQPLGVDIGSLWKDLRSSIAILAGEVCHRLSEARGVRTDDVPLIETRYVGPGYSIPYAESTTAISKMAGYENIRLDPVYTGKAFAGLLDIVAREELVKDRPIIFLHTGGV